MKTILFVLCFLMWHNFAVAENLSSANPQIQKQEVRVKELETKILSQQSQLNEQADKFLKLDLDVKKDLQNQNLRLSDIWGAVSFLSFIGGLLGILTTLIVIYFSLKTSKIAVAEARSGADDAIKSWVDSQGKSLLTEHAKPLIDIQVKAALKAIDDAATPILVKLSAELQKSTQLNQAIEARTNGLTEDATEEAALAPSNNQSDQDDVATNQAATTESDANIDTDLSLLLATSTPYSDEEEKLALKHQFKKVQSLLRGNHVEEAIAKLQTLIEALDGKNEPWQMVLYAEATIKLANVYYEKLGRTGMAIEELARLIDKFENSRVERVVTVLLWALYDLGYFLEHTGLIEDASRIYQKAIQLYADVLPQQNIALFRVGRSYNGLARTLYAQQKYIEAINLYYTFANTVANPTLGRFESLLAINAANSYLKLGDRIKAKLLLRDRINSAEIKNALYDNANNHQQEKFLLAQIYIEENNLSEALFLCEDIVKPYREENSSKTKPNILMEALLLIANIQSLHGNFKEEVQTYDYVQSIWLNESGETKERLSRFAAIAMVNKAIAQSTQGNSEDAIETINQIMVYFNYSDNPTVIEQKSKAEKLKAILQRNK